MANKRGPIKIPSASSPQNLADRFRELQYLRKQVRELEAASSGRLDRRSKTDNGNKNKR
jgi:hypothetical protein